MPFLSLLTPATDISLILWLISAHAKLPAYSSLEKLIQQITVVREYLQQELGKVEQLLCFFIPVFVNQRFTEIFFKLTELLPF